jgi:hypothetical protein
VREKERQRKQLQTVERERASLAPDGTYLLYPRLHGSGQGVTERKKGCEGTLTAREREREKTKWESETGYGSGPE